MLILVAVNILVNVLLAYGLVYTTSIIDELKKDNLELINELKIMNERFHRDFTRLKEALRRPDAV